MATLRIAHDEYRNGGLRPICMVCGEPADEFEPICHWFTYTSTWLVAILLLAGLFFIPILAVLHLFGKSRKMETPFCEEHRGYWTFRNWTNWAVFFSFLGMIGSCTVLGIFRAPAPALLSVILSFVVFFIFAAVFQHRSIRTVVIDDHDMMLVNVNREFRDAVHRDRQMHVELNAAFESEESQSLDS